MGSYINALPESDQKGKGLKKQIDNLKKGHLPGFHLLNRDVDMPVTKDYLVVDFRNVYGVNLSAINEIAATKEQRQRLLPPYREHLSQAFARYFMRVGLPQDIVVEGY